MWYIIIPPADVLSWRLDFWSGAAHSRLYFCSFTANIFRHGDTSNGNDVLRLAIGGISSHHVENIPKGSNVSRERGVIYAKQTLKV